MLERLSDANRARWFLLGSVLVTGTLYTIPNGWYVAYPLVLLSTYVHEIAHGLAAALVGGQFDSLVIHADGSGVASTSGNSGRFAFAFVAGAGLVGPAGGGACTAPGFLDSGLTVFASTLPRPARRGRVAPGRGFDSRISPASTVFVVCPLGTRARPGGVPRWSRSSAPTTDSPSACG